MSCIIDLRLVLTWTIKSSPISLSNKKTPRFTLKLNSILKLHVKHLLKSMSQNSSHASSFLSTDIIFLPPLPKSIIYALKIQTHRGKEVYTLVDRLGGKLQCAFIFFTFRGAIAVRVDLGASSRAFFPLGFLKIACLSNYISICSTGAPAHLLLNSTAYDLNIELLIIPTE